MLNLLSSVLNQKAYHAICDLYANKQTLRKEYFHNFSNI